MHEIRLTDEDLATIEHLSGCNYSPAEIALYLDQPKKEFISEWNKRESVIRLAYDRGKLEAKFKVNLKQKENAESGNITAAQIFLKESKEEEAKNVLHKILFGDDY